MLYWAGYGLAGVYGIENDAFGTGYQLERCPSLRCDNILGEPLVLDRPGLGVARSFTMAAKYVWLTRATRMKECEFVVIGAGIAGASAAFELATHGRVILLERESQPGYHTTGRSAATFFESYGNLTIRRLSKASRTFFEHPPGGFTEQPLLAPRGALYIAREDQRSLLSETLDEIKGLTPGVRELSVAEAIERVPVLRQDCPVASDPLVVHPNPAKPEPNSPLML